MVHERVQLLRHIQASGEVAHHGKSVWWGEAAYLMVTWKQKDRMKPDSNIPSYPSEGNCSSDLTFHWDLVKALLSSSSADLTNLQHQCLETTSYANHDTWGYLEKEEACQRVPCLSGKGKNVREPLSEHTSEAFFVLFARVCAVTSNSANFMLPTYDVTESGAHWQSV